MAMAALRAACVTIPLLVSAAAAAEEGKDKPGDDTLRFYLSRSDAIVVGTITEKPGVLGMQTHDTYFCRVQVTQVIKGNAVLKGELRVAAGPYWVNHNPYKIEKGATFTFCLKNRGTDAEPRWEVADPWFGLLPKSFQLAADFDRLSSEKAKK